MECPTAQRELFLTWLQTERSNFSYGHAVASLHRYITKAPGYNSKGLPLLSPLCLHFFLQSLHVVSTLRFLPKVRNKSPWPWGLHSCYHSPDVSTRLSPLPPFLFQKKKNPNWFNFTSFLHSPSESYVNYFKKPSMCVCICICIWVSLKMLFFFFLFASEDPPSPRKGQNGRRDLVPCCKQQGHRMPLDAGDSIHAIWHSVPHYPQVTSLTIIIPHLLSKHVCRLDYIMICSAFVSLFFFKNLLYFFPTLHLSFHLFSPEFLFYSFPLLNYSFASDVFFLVSPPSLLFPKIYKPICLCSVIWCWARLMMFHHTPLVLAVTLAIASSPTS